MRKCRKEQCHIQNVFSKENYNLNKKQLFIIMQDIKTQLMMVEVCQLLWNHQATAHNLCLQYTFSYVDLSC